MQDSVQNLSNKKPAPGAVQFSMTLDDMRDLKRRLTHNAPYAERVGFGLAVRLLELRNGGYDRHVLHEIDVLEGLRPHSSTKPARQFKYAPLHPLWHKHFSTPRHLLRNIGIHWGLDKGGNKRLDTMISNVAQKFGDEPDLWQKKLSHDFILGGFSDRVSKSTLTGDWIIFAKHESQNYYLDLATHAESAEDPMQLLKKLRDGSAWEYPFAF